MNVHYWTSHDTGHRFQPALVEFVAPEQPVGGEEPRAAWALAPQDGHLVAKGDEL